MVAKLLTVPVFSTLDLVDLAKSQKSQKFFWDTSLRYLRSKLKNSNIFKKSYAYSPLAIFGYFVAVVALCYFAKILSLSSSNKVSTGIGKI